MEIESLHHVSVNVRDLEACKRFYRETLGLPELPRPAFPFPGAWFQLGGVQQLHLIVHTDPLLRGDKPIDTRAAHFAMRVKDYRGMVEYLRSKGFHDDGDPMDPLHMRLQPHGTAGFPQIYIVDPDRNVIEINAARLEE